MTTGGRLHHLLAGLFNSQLNSADPVIHLLDFPTRANDPTLSSGTSYRDLFLIKFARYLKGCGHPDHPLLIPGLISREEYESVKGDRVYRVQRFLSLVTGSELMRANDPSSLPITVRIWV